MLHTAETMLSHCQRRLSTKRTKPRPAIIHIRQPSLSHSVSSAASSPTSSTHSLRSATLQGSSHHHNHNLHQHDEVVDFDPLLMHPTHNPPPARLADRPYIALLGHGPAAGAAVVDEDDPEPRLSQEEEDEWRDLIAAQHRRDAAASKELPLLPPPSAEEATPLARGGHAGHARDGSVAGTDYFGALEPATEEEVQYQQQHQPQQQGEEETKQDEEDMEDDAKRLSTHSIASTRPALRSHWSESTIQSSLASLTPTPAPDEEEQEYFYGTSAASLDASLGFDLARDLPPVLSPSSLSSTSSSSWPSPDEKRDSSATEREVRPLTRYMNFSYKRVTVPNPPQRPPLKTSDSVENFMKRGGWKRRGIVFQQDAGLRAASMEGLC